MVKLKISLICFLCLTTIITAQNVGINTTGATPSSSAILDIVSTDQGILIPRMTDAQRQALKDPATGLMIYNTSTNQLNIYNGSNWQLIPGNSVSTTSAGGTGPGGGIAINSSGASPHASAILDISSTEKGVIAPKTTQGSVTTPTIGLVIYNTSTNQVNFYDGSTWKILCPTTIDNNKGTSATANVGIGINASGTAPNISAALDVQSTSRGLLIPRMTSAQRDLIKTPAQGLLVYNTSNNRLESWTSSAWHELVAYTPATPGAITGNTTLCPNVTGQTYSISAVAGATFYTWTVPSGASITSGQGTTNITVSFGTSSGDVSVTASNGCGTSAARTLSITIYVAPIISAQPTSTAICSGGSTPFSVTASGTGLSYQWQYSNGGAYGNVSNGTPTGSSYSNQTTANMTVSGITTSGSSHFFRCVVSGTCSLSTNSSAVTLTVSAAPTTANAGSDRSICTSTVTLAGNTPTTGTGTWSLIMGVASITTPTSPTSGVTSLGGTGYNNTFRWTIANSPCAASTDDVVITSYSIYNCPCTWNALNTFTIAHTSGTVAPESKTVTYGQTQTSISGSSRCWITQNLGATNQANWDTDNSDAAAGWYWQFNRAQGYLLGTTPAWTITSISESSSWLPENDPCSIELGADWRIPTYSEWATADASWSTSADTYNSAIRLHNSGIIQTDGSSSGPGGNGIFWSSDQSSDDWGWYLFVHPIASHMVWTSASKALASPLRCLRN